MKILATDIGGSHLCSGIVDLDNNLLLSESIHHTKYDSFGSKQSILKVWKTHFRFFQNINRHSIALPGPFDYNTGIANYFSGHKLGSLSGQSFFDLFDQEILESKSDIVFRNDALCFGQGRALSVPDWHKKNLLFLTLGTGLGSCIIKESKVIESSHDLYSQQFLKGQADDYFSTRWFINYAQDRFGLQLHGVKEIITKLDKSQSEQMFEEFSENLFNFIKPYLQEHSAHELILGGNISKASALIGSHLESALMSFGITLRFTDDVVQSALLGAASFYNQES